MNWKKKVPYWTDRGKYEWDLLGWSSLAVYICFWLWVIGDWAPSKMVGHETGAHWDRFSTHIPQTYIVFDWRIPLVSSGRMTYSTWGLVLCKWHKTDVAKWNFFPDHRRPKHWYFSENLAINQKSKWYPNSMIIFYSFTNDYLVTRPIQQWRIRVLCIMYV